MSAYILTTPYPTYMVTRVLTNWFWWAMWVPNPDTPAGLSAVFPPHVILIKSKTDMLLSSRLLSAACAQKRSAPNSFCGSGWDQMLQQPVYVKSSFLIKCKDTLVDDAVIKTWYMAVLLVNCWDHSVHVLIQCEDTLYCYTSSHWLNPYPEWSLHWKTRSRSWPLVPWCLVSPGP